MIYLKTKQPGLVPFYATAASAAADLLSSIDLILEPGERAKLPTGVWIDSVAWDQVPPNMIPELQIRSRSGLAYKFGIILSNGVGTVDADYPDEICVLLTNLGKEPFAIRQGDRIAQVTLNLVHRLPGLQSGGQRQGGFGSTGV